ncbi:unnamed protein product [Darwinula stevensoni]|uniref:Uncharacterized protein n=1 Tax=Darwinula stevensoni TaxID=69355 RepID=A0A7R9FQ16_9CRUS|nr:unnamed protein product [Darwinula stevensoni]CAG0898668.1 unnamed protein product [Darwinula stevensoni]
MDSSVKVIPDSPWAVVMGASVYGPDKPSPVLQQRLNAAVKLYQAQKAAQLLMQAIKDSYYVKQHPYFT